MDKRAIIDRLDFAIELIQHVRDNLEPKPQELITAQRLLLEAYNKSKGVTTGYTAQVGSLRIIDLAN